MSVHLFTINKCKLAIFQKGTVKGIKVLQNLDED